MANESDKPGTSSGKGDAIPDVGTIEEMKTREVPDNSSLVGMDTHLVHIDKCARCGGSHDKLCAMPFEQPPSFATHWASCPITWDPILITFQPVVPVNG